MNINMDIKLTPEEKSILQDALEIYLKYIDDLVKKEKVNGSPVKVKLERILDTTKNMFRYLSNYK
jgi:hypothetical protein